MHVGIASPIYAPGLVDFLPEGRSPVQGMGGLSVTYLVDAMLRRGVRVSVFTLDPGLESPVRLDGEGLSLFISPFRKKGRMRDLMREERRYIEASVCEAAPDVVHAHWTYEYAHGALASGVPSVVTVRDWSPTILRFHPDLYRLGRFVMDRMALRKAKHLTANSPYLARIVGVKVGRPVPVTPNAVPASWFLDGVKNRQTRLTLCSINNGFDGRKNVMRLAQAFAEVRKRFPQSRLRLVGADHEKGGRAETCCTENGLDEGVEFLGSLSGARVREVLDSSDFLVHPALEESFGMTLVEAMSRKVVVIGGENSGAVPWVLGGGEAGRLVNVSDPGAIADAVCSIAEDEGTWADYSEKGYLHALTNFSADSVARMVLEIYDSVLKNV